MSDQADPNARPDKPESEEPGAQRREPPPELEGLREELERTREELHETGGRLDEIARAYAALVNEQKEARARLEREQQRVLEAEKGRVALQLLELGDELDRALAAAAEDEGPLAQGVRMIHEGLRKRLSAMGIERLALVGMPFDPNLAEAVDLVPVGDESLDDTVVAEHVPGYRLGERVLRAAKVRVARYVRPAEGPEAGKGAEPS